jgi:hypothetical protein
MILFKESVCLTVSTVDAAGNVQEEEKTFPAGSVVDARIRNATKLYADLLLKDGRVIKTVLRETFRGKKG